MATITAPRKRRASAGTSSAGMRREVGLVGLTFTSLGCVIGSGWLLAALEASSVAGPAALIAWGIAGVIVLALALVYAELGAAYPVAGGTSRVPHIAFGPIAGFASGWLAWLGTVTLAPIEVEAALQYLTPKIHAVTLTHTKGDAVILTGAGFGVGAVLLLLFAAINVMGVRKLSESNTTIVSWKVAIPLLTVIALVVTSFHGSNFSSGSAGGFMPFGWKGVLTALPLGVVFSLTGFEQAVQLGAEARNPGRDMPRAVIGSVIIGIVLYAALQLAFLGALSPSAHRSWLGESDRLRRLRAVRDARHHASDSAGSRSCSTSTPSSVPAAPA